MSKVKAGSSREVVFLNEQQGRDETVFGVLFWFVRDCSVEGCFSKAFLDMNSNS